MKANKLLMLLAAPALLFSCAKEASPEVADANQNKFIACTEATKITLENDFSLAWEQGDNVSVYDGTSLYTFTAESAGATTSLAAEGVTIDPEKTYNAVYPEAAQSAFTADGVTITIPAVQHLSSNIFEFTYGVAQTSGALRKFEFKNVASIVAFEITEINVSSVTIEATAGEHLTGTVTANFADGSSTFVEGANGKSLILTANEGFAPDFYYAAILPQTYSQGLTITLTKTDGSRTQRHIKAFTLPRSSYINLEKFDESRTWANTYTISTAAELQAFLLAAPTCSDEVVATLASDIDLAGVNLETASSFAGTLDGADHGLKNWSTGTPLFKTLSGTVKNLVIDETSQYNIRLGQKGDTENIANDAFIAGVNRGTVEKCINNAPMVREGSKNFGQSRAIASIVAVNEGVVKNCTNNGSISISAGGFYQLDQWIGGVVGKTAPESQEAISVEGCVNNGDITYTVAKNKSANFVGGVVGGTAANVATALYSMAGLGNYGTIKDCTNNADVAVTFSENVENMTNLNLGGVIGYAEGSLVNCNTVAGKSLSFTSPVEGSYPLNHCSIGGVAGFVLYSMTNCKNAADMNIRGMFKGAGATLTAGSGYYTQCFFGGVVGAAGPNTGEEAITNCDNSGAITVESHQTNADSARNFFGGIVGYGKASLNGCDNSGVLNFTSDSQYKFVGGIAGQSSYGLKLCNNSGALTMDAVITAADGTKSNKEFYLGGVSGYHVPATNLMINACQNSGNIIVKNGYGTTVNYVGGIAGYSLAEINGKDATSGITTSYNTGNIDIQNNCKYQLGGIAGTVSYKVLYAHNSGNITMNGINGGGIVGNSFIGGCIGAAQYKLSAKLDGSETAVDYGVGSKKAGYVCGNTGNVTVKAATATTSCNVALCFGKMNGTGSKTVGSLSTACQWHSALVSGALSVNGAQTNVGVIAGGGAPGGIVVGMKTDSEITFKNITLNGTAITSENLASNMGNGMTVGTTVSLTAVKYE